MRVRWRESQVMERERDGREMQEDVMAREGEVMD